MNNKIITIILVLLVIILAGFTYYLYSGVTKCTAIATDYGTKLQECGAGLNQCMTGVKTCQDVLVGLKQIPACASYLPAQ